MNGFGHEGSETGKLKTETPVSQNILRDGAGAKQKTRPNGEDTQDSATRTALLGRIG